jgi:hypothetical protein
MIGHEKKSARRQIFQADRGNAIKTTNQWPPNEIEGALSIGHGRHPLSFTFCAGETAIGKCQWNLLGKDR